ncbi:DUF1415 family protein [Rhodoflexus caldus]|uniref:DUF1415 family protein n=1 Tax=Rhodoflexus caldus TaxID=2891236 RepID=UPI00202ABA3B|nr:DUF1415 family protein [Rhodoflexus caldus]
MFKKEVKKQITDTTHRWLEQIIIGLNLCPFAKAPYVENKVRLAITDAANVRTLTDAFMTEIKYLDANPNKETTLLIAPAIQNVNDFHAVFMDCERLLFQKKLTDVYQIVSFHPLVRMAGYAPESPLNLVMMAPYPIIHILRTESVEKLGAKMRTDVQQTNSARLKMMSETDFTTLWKKMLGV